jgi:peptidoglycan/LPS O-acetylase OafA/YrhL
MSFERDMYHVAGLRLDAIAYGVALARLNMSGARLFRYPLTMGLLGAALIGCFWLQGSFGVWLPLKKMQYYNVQLVGTSVGCCLLLAGLQRLRGGNGPLARLIGEGSRISYGLYIMHLGIIVGVLMFAAASGFGRNVATLISLPLIFLLPYLSYRFFEAPILARRPRQHRPPAAAPRRAATAVAVRGAAVQR